MEKKKIISGRRPVLEYLSEIGHSARARLIVSKNAHGSIIKEITLKAQSKGIPIEEQDKSFFSTLGPATSHQGVLLKITTNTEKNQTERDLLKKAKAGNGVLLLLDQITDTGNGGAIIRTAEALGCDAVLFPGTHSISKSPALIKASAGATAHIPLASITNVASFLDSAREEGYWILGSSDSGSAPLSKLNGLRPIVIIIGSEGKGMRRLTAEKCDYIVSIPLQGKIASLNASVAAGIILYEALKQGPSKN